MARVLLLAEHDGNALSVSTVRSLRCAADLGDVDVAVFGDNTETVAGMAAALEGAERMQRLGQAERLLMRDMPVIPLFFYVSRHLLKPTISGFVPNVRDIHLSRYMGVENQQP